ncbi:hypothetical protein GJ688_11780 [Heliobacillus mobilis]|uniref:Uncharacterized protein n=1 Tax=Heliobacterium mobile TaxID=28064 RepID=A0A6I3SL70_HELMO|nr:hypothetical protein [Heliobacterium mobile]MTV49654.1 hypothetical protein [Heliobacterium mobile]
MNKENKKWCLLIRSVPFQQLDKIVPKVKEKFPEVQLAVLTHRHGVEMASKYQEVDEVIPYLETGSFDRSRLPEAVRSRSWDAVIAPVANESGSGFHNVLHCALAVPAKQHWMVNLPGEMTPIQSSKILWQTLRNGFYAFVAVLAASVLWLPWVVAFSLYPRRGE